MKKGEFEYTSALVAHEVNGYTFTYSIEAREILVDSTVTDKKGLEVFKKKLEEAFEVLGGKATVEFLE